MERCRVWILALCGFALLAGSCSDPKSTTTQSGAASAATQADGQDDGAQSSPLAVYGAGDQNATLRAKMAPEDLALGKSCYEKVRRAGADAMGGDDRWDSKLGITTGRDVLLKMVAALSDREVDCTLGYVPHNIGACFGGFDADLELALLARIIQSKDRSRIVVALSRNFCDDYLGDYTDTLLEKQGMNSVEIQAEVYAAAFSADVRKSVIWSLTRAYPELALAGHPDSEIIELCRTHYASRSDWTLNPDYGPPAYGTGLGSAEGSHPPQERHPPGGLFLPKNSS